MDACCKNKGEVTSPFGQGSNSPIRGQNGPVDGRSVGFVGLLVGLGGLWGNCMGGLRACWRGARVATYGCCCGCGGGGSWVERAWTYGCCRGCGADRSWVGGLARLVNTAPPGRLRRSVGPAPPPPHYRLPPPVILPSAASLRSALPAPLAPGFALRARACCLGGAWCTCLDGAVRMYAA